MSGEEREAAAPDIYKNLDTMELSEVLNKHTGNRFKRRSNATLDCEWDFSVVWAGRDHWWV